MSKLTNLKIKALQTRGMFGDGNGLYLRISSSGGKAWIQRIVINGRRRDLGLGSWPDTSLQAARTKAFEHRQAIAEGRDPVAEKQAAKKKAAMPTFREAAATYFEQNKMRWKPGPHVERWLEPLRLYAFPVFGDKAVNTIDRSDVLNVLLKIWSSKYEQATKVRQRIRCVMGWAQAMDFVEHNPAGEAISKALPRRVTVTIHHRVIHYKDLPKALTVVEQSHAMPSTKYCFLFTALTACRHGEARHAEWSEIDLDARIWTIPASHAKTGQSRMVPLSAAALTVLDEAKCLGDGSGLVFPGTRGKPIGIMTLSALALGLKLGFVPHGMRAAFRTWASENTSADYATMEMSLGHSVGSAVERCYARSNLIEKRRRLMEQWGQFVMQAPLPKVVKLRA